MENKKYKYNIDIQDEIVNIYSPYNEEMITFIKALPGRKWNPDNKCWSITKEYLDIFQSKFPQKEIVENNTISKEFIEDIIKYKIKFGKDDYIQQSKSLKPSNLHCVRRNVYVLAGLEEDETDIAYNYSECAKTGSMRHESIQDTLIRMTNEGSNWSYIDVADYVKEQQEKGFCKDIRVGSKKGAETHLYNDSLHLSFFCDGIVKYNPTGEYYLFEFKNKTSKKAKECDEFPEEHLEQVTIYCDCLNLNKVLLLVENRDTCELVIPPLFEVTDKMKQELRQRIEYSIDCFNKQIIPPKPENINCLFCTYKNQCKKVDEFNENPLKSVV